MSAVLDASEARLGPMTIDHVDRVVAVEQIAYSHPWTRGNFIDSLHAGYHCQVLEGGGNAAPTLPAVRGSLPPERALAAWGRPGSGESTLIGYFIAMKGVDEVHLLNITVAPPFQRRGWAPLMLEALAGWARGQQAQWLWLEVRTGNLRAQEVYLRHGFRRVGVRKGYYPGFAGRREDAIVMSLRLNEPASAWGSLQR